MEVGRAFINLSTLVADFDSDLQKLSLNYLQITTIRA